MGGAGACAGTGAGNAEKDTPPQAVERGRAGKRAVRPRFPGPRPRRNELYLREACPISLSEPRALYMYHLPTLTLLTHHLTLHKPL